MKAKGQAFVVFADVESARKAIEEVNGFEIFGKEMKCAFARERSDAYVKRTGGELELEGFKRRRIAEKGGLSSSILQNSLLSLAWPFLSNILREMNANNNPY